MFLFINFISEKYPSLILAKSENFKDYLIIDRAKGLLKAEKFLPKLNFLFKKNKLDLSGLKGAAALLGPGSFSACRRGVVAANILRFVLNIPLVGVFLNEISSQEEFIRKGLQNFKQQGKNRDNLSAFLAPHYLEAK